MGETIIRGCLIEKLQRELSHMGGKGAGSLYVHREADRRKCNMAVADVHGLPAEIRKPFCSKKNWEW
jgi:hypothetical protein